MRNASNSGSGSGSRLSRVSGKNSIRPLDGKRVGAMSAQFFRFQDDAAPDCADDADCGCGFGVPSELSETNRT